MAKPRCAICGSESDVAADHDRSGQWRGELCFHCKAGLGYFSDDVGRLRAGVEYLDRAQVAVTNLYAAVTNVSSATPSMTVREFIRDGAYAKTSSPVVITSSRRPLGTFIPAAVDQQPDAMTATTEDPPWLKGAK
jgi:hypothetical protein